MFCSVPVLIVDLIQLGFLILINADLDVLFLLLELECFSVISDYVGHVVH